MSYRACDGSGIVVIASLTTPGQYLQDVQQQSDVNPGSQYLRTDQACPSLNGNPIYAVYRPAGSTQADVCAAVRAAGGDAYGKWLDATTDPGYTIAC